MIKLKDDANRMIGIKESFVGSGSEIDFRRQHGRFIHPCEISAVYLLQRECPHGPVDAVSTTSPVLFLDPSLHASFSDIPWRSDVVSTDNCLRSVTSATKLHTIHALMLVDTSHCRRGISAPGSLVSEPILRHARQATVKPSTSARLPALSISTETKAQMLTIFLSWPYEHGCGASVSFAPRPRQSMRPTT